MFHQRFTADYQKNNNLLSDFCAFMVIRHQSGSLLLPMFSQMDWWPFHVQWWWVRRDH
jgi:hypothetical protein